MILLLLLLVILLFGVGFAVKLTLLSIAAIVALIIIGALFATGRRF